jgi:hypothetical protein
MKPTKAKSIAHAEYEMIQFLLEFKDLEPLQNVMITDEASLDRWVKAATRLKARLEKRQQSLLRSLPKGHSARED